MPAHTSSNTARLAAAFRREQSLKEDEVDFGDIVHYVSTRPSRYGMDEAERIYAYAALVPYALVHPRQFLRWVDSTLELSKSFKEAMAESSERDLLSEFKEKIVYLWKFSSLFFRAPFFHPEYHATLVAISEEGRLRWYPVKPNWVRVKWYPNAAAVRKAHWPSHLGEIWMDLPLDPKGGLDLRPAMRAWGMENCYTLDANRRRGEEADVSRYPVEQLSPLGVNVLLGETHEVIAIIEKPTRLMRDVRKARHRLLMIPDHLWNFIESTPRIAGKAVVSLAEAVWDGVTSTPYVVVHAVLIVIGLAIVTLCDIVGILGQGVWAILTSAIVCAVFSFLGRTIADAFRSCARTVTAASSGVCTAVRGAWAWIVAVLEAYYLSEDEFESLETSRRRAARAHVRASRHKRVRRDVSDEE